MSGILQAALIRARRASRLTTPHNAIRVCLKGRALWGQTQSGYEAVGARCKIGCGGSHWRLETRVGGIGVADVPSGQVEGRALGGHPPLPSSKALSPRAAASHTFACMTAVYAE